MVTRLDIQGAAGSLQISAGQISGIEAAIHAVGSLFQKEETEAILLVDGSNVFNSLNCAVCLHHTASADCVHHLSQPSLTPTGHQQKLFVDGDVLHSCEGTTQGDPLAAPMYALATIPLIKKLNCYLGDVSQVWYADDASAAGKIDRLRKWWSELASQGPKFGYFPSATETWLVTKTSFHCCSLFCEHRCSNNFRG